MIESPDLIQRLKKLVDEGSSFWDLFDRALISRSRAIELIHMLSESLPVEMEQAREIVGFRDKIIEEARQKAGEIVDGAVYRRSGRGFGRWGRVEKDRLSLTHLFGSLTIGEYIIILPQPSFTRR
ncbi:MAG: hypothetical protein NTY09_09465 [bacterium]|nr:hypothetical protein [bacterium]